MLQFILHQVDLLEFTAVEGVILQREVPGDQVFVNRDLEVMIRATNSSSTYYRELLDDGKLMVNLTFSSILIRLVTDIKGCIIAPR